MAINKTAASGETPIPVARPLLPLARDLHPYLERIDRQRVYSNWGPLVQELSQRLCDTFAVTSGQVVAANSGMSALMGAILATAGYATPKRRLAIVPDYTFAATALAARLCGYEVVLAPCNRASWSFCPADLVAHSDLLKDAGLVIPVSPFGRPVVQTPWVQFQVETTIPVVIDAAACFEALARQQPDVTGPLPVALSFHATKSFATGEGGCVVTDTVSRANKVVQALNFGFSGSRNSAMESFNGKMSEYAAAIGLAELDGWPQKLAGHMGCFERYISALGDLGNGRRLWGPPEISSSYVLLQCSSGRESSHLIQYLDRRGIGTRLWYGTGLRDQTQFATARQVLGSVGERLDPQTLVGLPTAPDLSAQDIGRVCGAIRSALA